MDDELPRPTDDALTAFRNQDLDRFSVDELDSRILALEAELVRTRAKKVGATQFRDAADSLFRR